MVEKLSYDYITEVVETDETPPVRSRTYAHPRKSEIRTMLDRLEAGRWLRIEVKADTVEEAEHQATNVVANIRRLATDMEIVPVAYTSPPADERGRLERDARIRNVWLSKKEE